MKKQIIFALLFISCFCFAQKNDNAELKTKYNLLLQYLSNEDWVKSEKLSKELLNITEANNEMETEAKVLRYMYIYSTAGLLNDKKLTKDQALKNVKFLQSKEMIMASRPFKNNCYSNCTHFDREKPNTFFTSANNKNATQIFSFEYVKIKNRIKETESELQGKYITLRGILNEISVDGNMLPRFTLKFIDGEYLIKE